MTSTTLPSDVGYQKSKAIPGSALQIYTFYLTYTGWVVTWFLFGYTAK